jgi:hypothetical protein
MATGPRGCYSLRMPDEMDDLAAESEGTPARKQPREGVRAIIMVMVGTILVFAFCALTWLLFHHPR